MKNTCKTKEGSGMLKVPWAIEESWEDDLCDVGIKLPLVWDTSSEHLKQSLHLAKNPCKETTQD